MAKIAADDDRRAVDEGFVEGCWGTVAEPLDESFYDDRSDADDDLEKGRIKFPAGRLYGRDEELDALRGLYGEVSRANDARVAFVGGYSGVGKSAVVAELVRRVKRERGAENVLCACGKYSNLQSATAPFSAIAESLGQLAADLTKPDHEQLLETVWKKLSEDAESNTEEFMSLVFPAVGPLFAADEKSLKGESAAPNMNEVGQAFKDFMNCICSCLGSPLIWFVDDCQWGDEASMTLLKNVLSCAELSNTLFIGSYRSNEVNEDHPFRKLMNDVEKSNSGATARVELYGLSPGNIGEFISDTLGKDGAPEVSTLTETVYAKTLGNIFFVKQALEELVRKNALFYDMMMFSWEYNLTKVELENYLSDDVIEVVQSKIEGQPQEIKKLVVVMSLIPNNAMANLSTITSLLGCEGVNRFKVEKLLRYSVKQGLINKMESKRYAFAHDKIREASFTLIPKGRPRDGLLVRISKVLLDLADSDSGSEWARFVAVDHMNSVEHSLICPLELSRLNFRVGEMNLEKGATFSANASFRHSLAYLIESGRKWKDQSTLKLLNQAIVSEFSMGNFEVAFSHVEDVLENATSLDDKFTAYLYRMKTFAEGENRDYDIGVAEGLKICELYDMKFPNPPKKSDLMKESLQLKAALRNRPLTVLSDLPPAEDSRIFILLKDLIHYANFSGTNKDLVAIIVDRSIQLALQKGLSKELMSILVGRAASLAKDLSKLKTANKLAVAADQISQVFREDDKALYAETQLQLMAMVFVLLRPFRECLDAVLDSYKPLLNAGRTYFGLGSGLAYSFMYFLVGLPLNSPLIEPKLIAFGDAARRLQVPTFQLLFNAMRQMLLNLREENEEWTALKGIAFDEDTFLRSIDGKARSMSLRDTSMMRLILAYVFWDEECMVKMLENLSGFTDPDISVSRSHLRLFFIGLAGFQTGQSKLANKCLEYFKSLSNLGSPNATPIYHFIKATAHPSREKYDEAISRCREGRLVHLMAMANERCGMYLNQLGDDTSREYLIESYWFYRDWGASSKANSMLRQHPFLHQATKEYRKDPSNASSNMRLANKRGAHW